MTIKDVHGAARRQGVRRLRDIELGVLETDGSFSFFTVEAHDGSRDGAPGGPRLT